MSVMLSVRSLARPVSYLPLYRLQRLRARKNERASERDGGGKKTEMENADTKAKTETEGYERRKKENKMMQNEKKKP